MDVSDAYLKISIQQNDLHLMKGTSFGKIFRCIRRRVRVCMRLTEAAKALATRNRVRDIGATSTLSNSKLVPRLSL
jgi:hypothetical protein